MQFNGYFPIPGFLLKSFRREYHNAPHARSVTSNAKTHSGNLPKCPGWSFFAILLVISLTKVSAQPVLKHRVALEYKPTAVSIDRSARVYIADQNGSVHKFDANGELLVTYSPERPGNIKSIEASSTLNVLLFYEDLQEYRFLDRFLTLTSTTAFSPDIFASLVTGSADNNLWIFDDSDFNLKKININYNELEIISPLINIVKPDFYGNALKEYQHLIFLSDMHTGVYVFDNLGNYIKILPLPNVGYFNFLANELYYLNDGAVHFYDLYTGEKRKIDIIAKENYLFALVSEKHLFLISKSSLDIFDLKNR